MWTSVYFEVEEKIRNVDVYVDQFQHVKLYVHNPRMICLAEILY